MTSKNFTKLSFVSLLAPAIVGCSSGANFSSENNSSENASIASTSNIPVVQNTSGMLRCTGSPDWNGQDAYMDYYVEVAKTSTGFDMTEASVFLHNLPGSLYNGDSGISVYTGIAGSDAKIQNTPVTFRLFNTKAKIFINNGQRYKTLHKADVPDLYNEGSIISTLDTGWVSLIVDIPAGTRPDAIALSLIDASGNSLETDYALLPPFAANPIIYSSQANRSAALTTLHPFSRLTTAGSANWTGVEEDFCVY